MTDKNKQERNIYATLFLNLLMNRMKKTLLHPNLRLRTDSGRRQEQSHLKTREITCF